MTITQKFALQIKKYRITKDISQRDLAEKMGVPHTTINRLESGEGGVNSTTMDKFCEVSGINIVFEKNTPDEEQEYILFLAESINNFNRRYKDIINNQ